MKTSTLFSKNFVKKGAGLLFWILIWQLLSVKIGKEVLLASPLATFKALVSLVGESAFWHTVLFSVTRILAGFFLGLFAGVLLASLCVAVPLFKVIADPFMSTVKAVPVASFIILALLWVSGKNLSVCISFLMVLPIVYSNMEQGFASIDQKLLEMAQVFNFSAGKKLLYIYLPGLLPYFTAACTASMGLCWKSGVAAEVIGLPSGSIGNRLYATKLYLDTPGMFAWTVVIIVISVIAQKGFMALVNVINEKIRKGFL